MDLLLVRLCSVSRFIYLTLLSDIWCGECEMAASTSSTTDLEDAAKTASLCRCPNKQYSAPFWLKVKQLFSGKKNSKSDEQKKIKKSEKSSSQISNGKICSIIVLVALFGCSSAACIIMWFTDLYLRQILETMTVHNGSFMFESWRKPSLKPLICVYAFNYTNLYEFIIQEDKKIRVEEKGPYCYRETLEKINVHFNEEEGTVTYGNRRTHIFDPDHSRGSPDDILVLPNLSLITAVSFHHDANILKKTLLYLSLKGTDSKVILRVRAHDFFFGYEDNFLKLVSSIAKLLNNELPFEKFGVLAFRAAVTDDTLTVKTGENDLEHIDVVTAVNGRPNLTIWFGDECNRIDGSDGAFFPRKDINHATTLYLFHQDICRRLPLVYDKDVDFQEGIMGMRFHMPPWVYDTNGTCFCDDNCPPKGTFDLSRCSHGLPFMMSFPHFLHGDPSLREEIEGLHPNISLHDFFIDIQPNLGFTLGMVSRLQVNIRVRKSPGLPLLRAFRDNVVLPIVWIEVIICHQIYSESFTMQHLRYGMHNSV
ncbi:lysosome membrane protein 2-like isoform X2 [Lycorma delicatula]|uniref:lysosome membrane protein 2-like isoform X2 n=1 Tax=Lycorma delicatula TaxID=130591 RepID=UPI003F513A75